MVQRSKHRVPPWLAFVAGVLVAAAAILGYQAWQGDRAAPRTVSLKVKLPKPPPLPETPTLPPPPIPVPK